MDLSPISLQSINLYDGQTQALHGKLVEGRGLTPAVERDLNQAAGRDLPDGAITHHPIRRYTEAQMEMRPAQRADAALMAVVEPDNFKALAQAWDGSGDWRALLEQFAQRLGNHPEWLGDEYRLPAANILRATNYFMDLSVLEQLGLVGN